MIRPRLILLHCLIFVSLCIDLAHAGKLENIAKDLGALQGKPPIRYHYKPFAHPPAYCQEYAHLNPPYCENLEAVPQEVYDAWTPEALEAENIRIVFATTSMRTKRTVAGILKDSYNISLSIADMSFSPLELIEDVLDYKPYFSASIVGKGQYKTFLEEGVILRVPVSCLIAAYPQDIWSPYGVNLLNNTQDKVNRFLSGLDGNAHLASARQKYNYSNHIKSPQEVLRNTAYGSEYYNELLIAPISPTGERVQIIGCFHGYDKHPVINPVEEPVFCTQSVAEKLGILFIKDLKAWVIQKKLSVERQEEL